MINLEICVHPKSSKYLEFSQSLEFIRPRLEKYCTSIKVTEKDKAFTIVLHVGSAKELTALLHSKDLGVLSGTIRTLSEKSEVIIHGAGHKREESDLHEIRLSYLKRNKKTTI